MQTLFRALQLAPSANNSQNWEFVFVGDADLKRRLAGACYNQSFITDCSYFIAGVADPELKWHMVDITIAFTNFTLEAIELGYGTCWIGAFDESRVKEILEVPNEIDESRVKEILEVPNEKKIVVCMTFGMPAGSHVPRGRKVSESFIYLDRYGRTWKCTV
jgi:nitroreductase